MYVHEGEVIRPVDHGGPHDSHPILEHFLPHLDHVGKQILESGDLCYCPSVCRNNPLSLLYYLFHLIIDNL